MLKFPIFVPQRIQAAATAILDGHDGLEGWLAEQESLRSSLAGIEDNIRRHSPKGDADELGSLHRKQRELAARLQSLSQEIACLDRLMSRDEMEQVYDLLSVEFAGDEDLVWLFLFSALGARFDVTPHRENQKRVREIRDEVAEAAGTLASSLERLAQSGASIPEELFSIRALLAATEANGRHQSMWKLSKHHVLGGQGRTDHSELPLVASDDSASAEENDGAGCEDIESDFDFEVIEVDPSSPDYVDRSANTQYAWSVAPSISELIMKIATVANSFEPKEYQLVGAALSTRQRSEKAEYLRAFGHLLQQNEIKPTPSLREACAITATVVLDNPENAVTSDDVRKAIR